MIQQIKAPWTTDQVAALNWYQHAGAARPFLCAGNRHDAAHRDHAADARHRDAGILEATPAGLICRACSYRQDWAVAQAIEAMPVEPTWYSPPADDALQLIVDRHIVATIHRWTNEREMLGWAVYAGIGSGERKEDDRGIFMKLEDACRVALAEAGIDDPAPWPPPADLLAEYACVWPPSSSGPAPTKSWDEILDGDQAPASLEDRLAVMLAEVIDATLMTINDPDGGGHQIELRLSAFNRDLADRAAALLEEAGR